MLRNKRKGNRGSGSVKRKKVMDKRESFYAYSVESLGLDATESKIFLSAARTVGEQFSSEDLESIRTYCEKSKKGGWEADSVVEDISEENLIECNEDDAHHLQELIAQNDDPDNDKNGFGNAINLWECPFTLKKYIICKDQQMFTDKKSGFVKDFAHKKLNSLDTFLEQVMIRKDVPSNGDCFLTSLYCCLKDNDWYWEQMEQDTGDENVFSGKRPNSREEFAALSREFLGRWFLQLDDEPDGRLDFFLCTVEDRAQECEEHEPNSFITCVFRELCKNLKDQATKQLFAKLLATPGSRCGAGLVLWILDDMTFVIAEYWRVGVLSYSMDRGNAAVVVSKQPLVCMFTVQDEGHFNYYCTKNKKKGSFTPLEIGTEIGSVIMGCDFAVSGDSIFGENHYCSFLEMDYIEGRLEPLVQSNSISRKLCEEVAKDIMKEAKCRKIGLEVFLHCWWHNVHRGRTLNDDEFLNRSDFKSFPLPEKTIAIDQLPEAPTYDVSQEVPCFSFPMVPISLLTLIPFFGSCYTRLQKYPFLQEKSASQPRHAQNRLMNHQKAIGPNGFLHLLYDSTNKSDCAIVDVQTEPLSVFWYSTKPSSDKDDDGSLITGSLDAHDYSVETPFAAEVASLSCLDSVVHTLFCCEQLTNNSDAPTDSLYSLGRLLYIINKEFGGLCSSSYLGMFHSYLRTFIKEDLKMAFPPLYDEHDLMWQTRLMLQSLHTVRAGTLDGQQRQFSLILRLSGKTVDPKSPSREVQCLQEAPLDTFMQKILPSATVRLFLPNSMKEGHFTCDALMNRSSQLQDVHLQASPTSTADVMTKFLRNIIDVGVIDEDRYVNLVETQIFKSISNKRHTFSVKHGPSRMKVCSGGAWYYGKSLPTDMIHLICRICFGFGRVPELAKVLIKLLSMRSGSLAFGRLLSDGSMEAVHLYDKLHSQELSEEVTENRLEEIDAGDVYTKSVLEENEYQGPFRTMDKDVLLSEGNHFFIQPQLELLSSITLCKDSSQFSLPWKKHACKILALNIIEVYSEFGFSCHACVYKTLSNKISNFCKLIAADCKSYPHLPKYCSMGCLFSLIALFIKEGVLVPKGDLYESSRAKTEDIKDTTPLRKDDLQFLFLMEDKTFTETFVQNIKPMHLFAIVEWLLYGPLTDSQWTHLDGILERHLSKMSIDPSTMADCEEQEDGSNEQEDVNIGKAHDDAANASGSCANTNSPDMESEEEESASNVEKPGEEESEKGGADTNTRDVEKPGDKESEEEEEEEDSAHNGQAINGDEESKEEESEEEENEPTGQELPGEEESEKGGSRTDSHEVQLEEGESASNEKEKPGKVESEKGGAGTTSRDMCKESEEEESGDEESDKEDAHEGEMSVEGQSNADATGDDEEDGIPFNHNKKLLEGTNHHHGGNTESHLPNAEKETKTTFLGEHEGANNETSDEDADKESLHVDSDSGHLSFGLPRGKVNDVTALQYVEVMAKSPFLAVGLPNDFTRRISDFPEASFPKVKCVSDNHGECGMLIETQNCNWQWDANSSRFVIVFNSLPVSKEEDFMVHAMLDCHEFTVIFVHAFGSFSSRLLPAIAMPECSIQAIKFHERDKEDPSVCCTEESTHYFFSLTQFQRYVDLRKSNPTDDIKLIGWVNDEETQCSQLPLESTDAKEIIVKENESIYGYDIPVFAYAPSLKEKFFRDSPLALDQLEQHSLERYVNRDNHHFSGPNMYWAAPPLEKSSTIVTGLHVDANFFADALHTCMEGYNEVVLFPRVNTATFDKLCKIMDTNGKAHKIEHNVDQKWPTVEVLEDIKSELSLESRIEVIGPGHTLFIPKGCPHMFRKLKDKMLPRSDCHYYKRQKVRQEISGSKDSYTECVSIAFDYTNCGSTIVGCIEEASYLLETLESYKKQAQEVAEKAASSSKEETVAPIDKLMCNPMQAILRMMKTLIPLSEFANNHLTVCANPFEVYHQSRMKSLIEIFLPHIQESMEAEFALCHELLKDDTYFTDATCSDCVPLIEGYVIETPGESHSGGDQYFCNACNIELSNAYARCSGCQYCRDLSHSFHVCLGCVQKEVLAVSFHHLNHAQHRGTVPFCCQAKNPSKHCLSAGRLSSPCLACVHENPPCPEEFSCMLCCGLRCHLKFQIRYRFIMKDDFQAVFSSPFPTSN